MALPSLKQTLTEDRFWGYVLIAIGLVSIIYKPFDRLDAALHKTADAALTIMLIGLALVVISIAFFTKPGTKALAIFWIVAP